MGRSWVHKVAISFIHDEGNVIRLGAVGKSSDKGGRVYSTRLVNSILSYSTRISKATHRVVWGHERNRSGLSRDESCSELR
jgi:hypothetical protein